MNGKAPATGGEALRQAVRWLGLQDRVDAARVEEASQRFGLGPADEDFLLREFLPPAAARRDGAD